MRNAGPKTSSIPNFSLQNLRIVPRDPTKVKPSKRNRVVLELRFTNARGYSWAALLTTRSLCPGLRNLSSANCRLWEPWLSGTSCFTPHIRPRIADRLLRPWSGFCSCPRGLTFSPPRVLDIKRVNLTGPTRVTIRRMTSGPRGRRPLTSRGCGLGLSLRRRSQSPVAVPDGSRRPHLSLITLISQPRELGMHSPELVGSFGVSSPLSGQFCMQVETMLTRTISGGPCHQGLNLLMIRPQASLCRTQRSAFLS